ncbi:Protease 3, partial [termite gut metagenome]
VCKEGEIEDGITALLREIERARRFGFTESEYTRLRAEYLRHLESAYNERDKRKNNSYVNEYVRLFLDNEPAPGIENEYALFSQIAPNISVQDLNRFLVQLITETNQVITLFLPDKEGLVYPDKETIRNILKQVKAEELTAYVDNVSNEPLISQLPKAGKIMSEKQDDIFGTTTLTLSNGIKAVIKKTDFKADEILMKGISWGGNSLFSDSDIVNSQIINQVIAAGGLGDFSATNLEKALAGKRASVSTSIGRNTEAVNGRCSPKDFETMMQLTYLNFTAPRKDENAFTSFINRTKASLQNQELYPMVSFSDSIISSVYMNHPRTLRLKMNRLDEANYDKILSLYNDRYKDAGDFTFIFVGNIDTQEVKPYIELYLASLPTNHRVETFKDLNIPIRKGIYKNEFIREQETAKASNLILYSGKCDYNLKNNILISVASQILHIVYTEKVREDEGGTYGVSVSGDIDKFPKEKFEFEIYFDAAPVNKNKLMNIIYTELGDFVANGPSEVNLNKVKEYMLKKHKEDLKENSYWQETIDEYYYMGVDRTKDYEAIVSSLTVNELKEFAAGLFTQGNRIEVNMISPEKVD